MENRKVLIIGASGSLGQDMVKVFKGDFSVIAWDKEDLDITKREDVVQKIVELSPVIVINTAAYNAVDKCEEDKKEFELAKNINGFAVEYLAEVSKKINAVFVHYSTDYVFDGDKKEGYNEEDRPNPISNYGKSKLLGEKKIQEINKNDDLDYYIIRTSKLFGKLGISEVSKNNFFDTMINISNNKKELKVVNGELSLFTYTLDLAQATFSLLKGKKKKGIYHITNSNPCTWYEAAKYLFELANRDIKVVPVEPNEFPRLAKRPEYSILLNTKLDSLRSWKDALREYLNI